MPQPIPPSSCVSLNANKVVGAIELLWLVVTATGGYRESQISLLHGKLDQPLNYLSSEYVLYKNI